MEWFEPSPIDEVFAGFDHPFKPLNFLQANLWKGIGFEKWRTACLFELIKLCKYLLMHSVMTSSARYTGEVALEIKRETAKYS